MASQSRRHFFQTGLGAGALGLGALAGGGFAPADPAIELGPWSGAVTPSGFRVKARLAQVGNRAWLRVSTDEKRIAGDGR
jgi:hypothetical protein